MSRRKQRRIIALLITILGLLVGYTQQTNTTQKITSLAVQQQPGLYQVTDFVDGDTISVNMNGTIEKVRMIGVDTPETHDPRKAVQCFGKAASDFTKTLIGNQSVRLEADPDNTNRDRYSRLLRYVYLTDGRMVNLELIKQGYGFAYTYFPFSKIDEFRSAETQARANNTGLWGSCPLEIDNNGQTRSGAVN